MAHLATIGADGAPHLVPVTFAIDASTLYTAVDDKPKRHRRLVRIANVARDPRVTVLVDHYDENWTQLWWCRIRGSATVVDAGATFEDGIRTLAGKYAQYAERAPEGPLIVVHVAEVTGWSAR